MNFPIHGSGIEIDKMLADELRRQANIKKHVQAPINNANEWKFLENIEIVHLYFIKITRNRDLNSLFKIGISANLEKRFATFSMNGTNTIEILLTIPFTNRDLALEYEKYCHDKFSRFRLDTHYASTFIDSGATECFRQLDAETMLELFSQLISKRTKTSKPY